MRGRTALPVLAALLMLAAAPAALLAEDARPEAGGGLWPEHAATDDAVAREGRAAMPFTASQIEALGLLLRETQGAASLAADPPPEGRIRRVRIGSPGEGAIPVIAVRKGYVTAVSFTDATGAPWPIGEVLVDRRFLPAAVLPEAVLPEAAGSEGEGDGGAAVWRATSSIWPAGALPARQRGGQAARLGGAAGREPAGRRHGGGFSGRGKAGPARSQCRARCYG